jgi:hypothetical protein
MAYEIRYFENRQEIGRERWPGSFEETKGLARAAVDGGDYDRAEVRDAEGVRYHWPRVMKAARA